MILKQIQLHCSNPIPLQAFYGGQLGFRTETSEGKLKITAGESELLFEPTHLSIQPVYHFAFNIPFNKIEESIQWIQPYTELIWLQDHHGVIAEFKSWNARSFYFLDPEGNILEFIGRKDLNDLSDDEFSSALVRNISEIGIVFPSANFRERVDAFRIQYDLDYFSKQPPMEHFAALGDDRGLFVAVPENRPWFSTAQPAGIFPMEIKFYAGNNDLALQEYVQP